MPPHEDGYRAEARVDLQAIRHNVGRLAEAATTAQVMAVVKADGYGHGLVESALAAIEGGAAWLGVATVREARALRSAGVQVPVLALLLAAQDPIAEAGRDDIDLTVGDLDRLDDIVAVGRTSPRPVRIHLEFDSGMGRGGATYRDWPDLVAGALRAERAGAIHVIGIWSHLASADVREHPSVPAQTRSFSMAVRVAERVGVHAQVRHLANSAGTLVWPETHWDLVRPGLSVFGISPSSELGSEREFGLIPAMTLTSRIASTKRVPAGQRVSYGGEYQTADSTSLAVVPVGYADGLPRSGAGVAPLAVNGRCYRVAGRVCMDQVVIDVGEDPVSVGDRVTVFGNGSQGELPLSQWAALCGTIPNEVLTRIGSRVARIYV